MAEEDKIWTIESLRMFLEAQLAALAQLTDERFASSAIAILKSETSQNRRFESINEFRNALIEQAGQLMGREEFQRAHQALIDKMEDNDKHQVERLEDLALRVNKIEADVAASTASNTTARLNTSTRIAVATATLFCIVVVVNILQLLLR